MGKRPRQMDPAEVHNRNVLMQREQRIRQQESEANRAVLDLGLDIKQAEPASAVEFLRDAWDKQVFGEPPKTTTRVVYGPDPLVNNCPEFHERLEKYGLEEVAAAYRDLVMKQGASACPDPVMRKGVAAAIAKFGKEATAQAFYDRVMKIPSREVEVEVGNQAFDTLLVNPMRDLVAKYCPPGMSPKFLSHRCIEVLGKRGYEIVKDENGDPVRCGTLIMGVIPKDWADQRREKWAQDSRDTLREQEELYIESAAKMVRDGRVAGIEPLQPGESISSSSAINDSWLDETRAAGFTVG